jgi:hypothetical protein
LNYSSRILELRGVFELGCLAINLFEVGGGGVQFQSHAKQTFISHLTMLVVKINSKGGTHEEIKKDGGRSNEIGKREGSRG